MNCDFDSTDSTDYRQILSKRSVNMDCDFDSTDSTYRHPARDQ